MENQIASLSEIASSDDVVFIVDATKEESVIENEHPERLLLPKSVSVRSNAYTKASVGRASGLAETQKTCVGGSEKEGVMEVKVYNQGMTKTELCTKWQEIGTCPYGESCRFAHGVKELRPIIRHPRFKNDACKWIVAGGVCRYGHRCHFRHTLTEQEKQG